MAAKASADIANACREQLDLINREKTVTQARKARLYIERVMANNRAVIDSLQSIMQDFQQKNKIVALEVNMRPPGGMTTDMFNYANDIDIYLEWANIIVHNRFEADVTRPYHCAYVGRKFNRHYTHPHQEIMGIFGDCCIPHHEPISGVFSAALGDYGYLVRNPDLDDVIQIANFICFGSCPTFYLTDGARPVLAAYRYTLCAMAPAAADA